MTTNPPTRREVRDVLCEAAATLTDLDPENREAHR